MTFYATLKQTSPVDASWRRQNRKAGVLADVLFTLSADNIYRSKTALDPNQLVRLKNRSDVIIAALSQPPS